MNTPPTTTTLTADTARPRLCRLGFYGLAAHLDPWLNEPWLARLIDIEETERQHRSLKRRLDNARLGPFKPLADFDWSWPTQCDRGLVEELFSLAFIKEAAHGVLIGPNGLGKTMLLKNLAHQALLHGLTARFTLASDMLHDLAAQDPTTALARRLRRYTTPTVLAIDELGYLSYDARYADLLFEVITRRYQEHSTLSQPTNRSANGIRSSPMPPASSPSSTGSCTAPRSSPWQARATASKKLRNAPLAKQTPAPQQSSRRALPHDAT